MPAAVTTRLDHLLVERGLAPSGSRARALIMAGRVRVTGKVVDKAGARIDREAEVIVASPPHPFASRGGVKLQGALRDLGVDPVDTVALDVGASTGGFTDCLLQNGASQVIALDVGHGQLDWTLRNDSRVIVIEKFNARLLTAASLREAVGERMDIARIALCVIDVSFISLALILPPLAQLPGLKRTVCLVKPQFEVGRGQVGKGGIVRDPAGHRVALEGVVAAADNCGWSVAGVCRSSLEGADGNREFFLHLLRADERDTLPAAGVVDRIRVLTESST